MVGGMGFKDLALHNDAILAKQVWRLLHNKTSLFYKVFKARFFPNYSIMEATDSRSGSYARRSLLIGRETFYKGELGGGLGMVRQLKFGSMGGFQGKTLLLWLPTKLSLWDRPRFEA